MSPAPTSVCGADGGGGGSGTEIVDDAVLFPAAAVTVAVPGPTPVTSPDCDTAATAELLDDQTTVVEFVGTTVAVNETVAPTSTVALVGETEIDLTFPDPPFAKLGERLSGLGGLAVSEQAANTRATAASEAAATATVRVRMRESRSEVRRPDTDVRSPGAQGGRYHAPDRLGHGRDAAT